MTAIVHSATATLVLPEIHTTIPVYIFDIVNYVNGNLRIVRCVKSVRIWSFLVRIFPHSKWIRRDTEYSVSLHNDSKCGKIRTRETLNTDTFTQCGVFDFCTSLYLDLIQQFTRNLQKIRNGKTRYQNLFYFAIKNGIFMVKFFRNNFVFYLFGKKCEFLNF